MRLAAMRFNLRSTSTGVPFNSGKPTLWLPFHMSLAIWQPREILEAQRGVLTGPNSSHLRQPWQTEFAASPGASLEYPTFWSSTRRRYCKWLLVSLGAMANRIHYEPFRGVDRALKIFYYRKELCRKALNQRIGFQGRTRR
jgi:hypothetical protein